MGVVCGARDRKLGREVALKLLFDELARGRRRLQRFDRQARLLAALNHPNVATLFSFEKSEGRRFLVMELVRGEPLEERIANGPLSWPQAQPLFVEMAAGLEAAHESGIVHRDLKPANVKITDEGEVKILDFGLANTLARGPLTRRFASPSSR